MLRWLLVCVLALFAFAGPVTAQAPPQAAAGVQRYALVVGVSGYSAGIPPLQGPKNDASLITSMLLEQDVSRANIRLLADQMDTAVRPIAANGTPTRANILAGFEWLATRGGPNVEIMIFMAGHGTQIPAGAAGNEDDRMTEVFLPLNASATATQQGGGVSFSQARNFLTDDNINDALRPILATGARVWLVVDACHSGTLSRSAGDDSVAREVPPEVFGAIPPPTTSVRAPAAQPPRDRFSQFRGQRLTAFYAAQPYQRAYESSQPRASPGEPQRKYGELTWSLAQALRGGEAATYNTIAQRVLAGVWQISGNRQTPMFEGAMNEPPMYGSGAHRLVGLTRQDQQLFLASGWTEEVTDGSSYQIIETTTQRVLGTATVDDVGATTSRLVVAPGADASLASTAVNRMSARLRQRSVPFAMSVARPQILPGTTPNAADQALLSRVGVTFQNLAHRPVAQQPVAFELSLPGQPADLYPYVADGRLWFFLPGTPLDISHPGASPYRIEPASDATSRQLETDVSHALWVIGRARNLRRVAAAVAESDVSRALRVRLFVEPGDGRARTTPCPDGVWRTMASVPANVLPRQVAYTTEAPRVHHCDTVYVELRNAGPVTLDIGAFYIDTWSQVVSFIPEEDSSPYPGVVHLEAGRTRVIAYPEDLSPIDGPNVPERDRVPVKPEGTMSLLMLAVPFTPGGLVANFGYLEQAQRSAVMRNAGMGGFQNLLIDAGLLGAETTRSGGSNARAERGGAVVVPIVTTSAPRP